MTIIRQTNNWETEKVGQLAENWESLAPGVQRFRLPGNEPVRRIITGHRPLKVGGFWSWKNMQHVAHESAGEEWCARVLEVHPTVSQYFGQPEQIRFQLDGMEKPVRYTPDFLIMFGHRELRIEYKPYDLIRPPAPENDNDEEGKYRFQGAAKVRKRLAMVSLAYREANIDWALFTDRDLAAIGNKATIDEIVANAGRPTSVLDVNRLVGFLKGAGGQATMEACAAQLQEAEFPRGAVLSRIPERIVSIDLHAPIDDDTTVILGEAA